MKSIVLIGHAHGCPLHVAGTVESGASTTFVNGRAVARVGDRTSCGAIIETGANCLLIERQPADMKVEVWNKEHYDLKLIFTKQASSLGVENTVTQNSQSNYWALPDWTNTIQNSAAAPQATAKFSVPPPAFL